MNYWIFKCDPEMYRLEKRMKDMEPSTTWKVTRYRDEIRTGDIAFIWKTGKDRGICAVMQIDSDPCEMHEYTHENTYNEVYDTELRVRVKGRFTHRFPCLSHKIIKKIDALKSLSVFSGYQQTTNFIVTQAEGVILMKLVQGQ